MRKSIIAASLLAGIFAAGSASAAGIAAGSAPHAQSPLLHRIDDPSLGDVLRWRLRNYDDDDRRGLPERYSGRWDDDDHLSRREYRQRLRRLDAERRDLRREYREDRRDYADRDGRRDRDRDWFEEGRENDAQRFFRSFLGPY